MADYNQLGSRPQNSLWYAAKQYLADAAPGGSLSREWTPERVEMAKTALGFTPVVGDALSAYDVVQSAKQGEYGDAALNAIGVLPFVPPLAGIFIGKKSKQWNNTMHAMAERMEKQGTPPEQIWEATGNWKAPDGKRRQEINDVAAKFRLDFNATGATKANKYRIGIEGPIGGVYTHDELYKAYPQILEKDRMTVGKLPDWIPATSQTASHRRSYTGEGRTELRSRNEVDALTQAIHELQHGVQDIERFSPGGSESLFGSGDEAFQQYRRLAGEAEARAAAARRMMTPEQRRATFPPQSYDVPLNKLIIR